MDLSDCIVEYRRDGGNGHFFTMTEDGVPVFHVNNADLSPEGRKHWGNRLLNAAALCCICTTLASDLTKRGVEVKSLTGRIASMKEKDSVLRTRISELEAEIEVNIGDADQAVLDECIEIVNNDTLTMYSLREGIDVTAGIKRIR
jgi:organic hydroperoxide reductase OsmC/OhrA